MAISIGDGGKWFSTGKVNVWEKTDNGVKGSADLWEKGGAGGLVSLSFEVDCGK